MEAPSHVSEKKNTNNPIKIMRIIEDIYLPVLVLETADASKPRLGSLFVSLPSKYHIPVCTSIVQVHATHVLYMVKGIAGPGTTQVA